MGHGRLSAVADDRGAPRPPIVGSYLPRYDADSGQVNWALAALAGKVSIGGGPAADGGYAWTPPG